jgi:hypothetical protein
VLRRTFVPKRGEVTGEWRKVHNEELIDRDCSPNIVQIINSRRMRGAGNVARMGESRGVYSVLVGWSEGKRPLGRPGLDRKIIVKLNLKKSLERVWTRLVWLRGGTIGGLL